MTQVLVIDDEAPIRLLCRVNLEAEGMSVLEAGDGPSGLDSARTAAPDVILLDVMMPGLDGWGVAEALLEASTSGASTTSRSRSTPSSWRRSSAACSTVSTGANGTSSGARS
jgi:two-component system OmpR family response regulator